MKLVNPTFEILEQAPGLEGIYEAIERAGRTCYKSKRPEGQTAKDFVDRMIASKHYAMLEHGTVYLRIPFTNDVQEQLLHSRYLDNPYSCIYPHSEEDCFCVTTNFRVLVENNWLEDLQYLCEPTEHEKRITVRFTTSNGIMREFTRHRVFSFAVESTRYCNYNKDKFNKELTFVIPSWSGLKEGTISHLLSMQSMWDSLQYTNGTVIKDNYPKGIMDIVYSWKIAENMYINGTLDGLIAQQAREVLPLATKCDMVMTGFVSDWNHFFDLRARGTTGAPHPDAKALAKPLMQEFEKRNLL